MVSSRGRLVNCISAKDALASTPRSCKVQGPRKKKWERSARQNISLSDINSTHLSVKHSIASLLQDLHHLPRIADYPAITCERPAELWWIFHHKTHDKVLMQERRPHTWLANAVTYACACHDHALLRIHSCKPEP